MKFKVGDIVKHVLYDGEFELEENKYDSNYPLLLRVKDSRVTLTVDGKQYSNQDNPTIILVKRSKKFKTVEKEIELIGNLYDKEFAAHETIARAKATAGTGVLNPHNKVVKIIYQVEEEVE